jgi:hypothetical protein
MTKDEAKTQSDEQELVLLNKLLAKQQEMIEEHGECDFIIFNNKECELAHLDEMVKLAHKIRSLLD